MRERRLVWTVFNGAQTLFSILPIIIIVVVVTITHITPTSAYNFGILSKVSPQVNQFYQEVKQGCEDAATEQNDTCYFDGPITPDHLKQDQMLRQLYNNTAYNHTPMDGIAVAVLDNNTFTKTLNEFNALGRRGSHGDGTFTWPMPIITFDSDAPESARNLSVTTNNDAMGQALAKVLLKLESKDTEDAIEYAIVSSSSGPNLELRVTGVRNRLNETNFKWKEIGESDCKEDYALAREQIQGFLDNSTASKIFIISVGGWPMYDTYDGENAWINMLSNLPNHEKMVSIIADATNSQISLFKKGYADALVAQEPYQMGRTIAKKLRELLDGDITALDLESGDENITNTHILQLVREPIELDVVDFNYNSIKRMVPLGYCAFAIIASLSIGFAIWTFSNRRNNVIRASQPFFLYMICAGVFITSFVFVTLSIDDQSYTPSQCEAACTALNWLGSIGLSTTFSALFGKLWRINKIFESCQKFKRIEVTVKDVMIPFITLLVANLIILILWTVLDPDHWERKFHDGSDDWNRPISSYGKCYRSSSYRGALLALVVSVLMFAIYQAFKARNIATDFSESKHIGIVVVCMLQILILAIPTAMLSTDKPQVSYLIYVVLGFVMNIVVLLFIFVPKVKAVLSAKRQLNSNSYLQYMSENRTHYVMYGMNTSYLAASLQPSYDDGNRDRQGTNRVDSSQINYPLEDLVSSHLSHSQAQPSGNERPRQMSFPVKEMTVYEDSIEETRKSERGSKPDPDTKRDTSVIGEEESGSLGDDCKGANTKSVTFLDDYKDADHDDDESSSSSKSEDHSVSKLDCDGGSRQDE